MEEPPDLETCSSIIARRFTRSAIRHSPSDNQSEAFAETLAKARRSAAVQCFTLALPERKLEEACKIERTHSETTSLRLSVD